MIFRYVPPFDLALQATSGGVCFKLTDTVPEFVLEAVRNKLNLWYREWFLDLREGVPYREAIIGEKNTNLIRAQRVLEKAVEAIPHVIRVEDFDPNFDPQTRTLSPVMKVIISGGRPIDIDARRDRSFVLGGV